MEQKYKKYICVICGLVYDEAEGWEEDNIPPGTRWEDVVDTWCCPRLRRDQRRFRNDGNIRAYSALFTRK